MADFQSQVFDSVLGATLTMFTIDAKEAIAKSPTRFSFAGAQPLNPPLTAAASLLEAVTISSVNWQNFGLVTVIPGQMITKLAPSFVAKIQFTVGSPVINACAIKQTLTRSTAVVNTTLVTFNNGAAYPLTLTTPKTIVTDLIPLALDNDHDYWFAITFANNAQNSTLGVVQDGGNGRNLSINNAATDYTTASTMPGLGSQPTQLLLGFYA